jgi:hypothetical protein
MKKPKFRIKVWIITWPKGTTEEWQEEPNGPKDFQPIGVEPYKTDATYYCKKEKRQVRFYPTAVFESEEEARAWEKQEDSEFTVRPGYLEIF